MKGICSLPTAYSYCLRLLPTAFCLLPTAFCLLPTAFCLLPTAFCLLPTEVAGGEERLGSRPECLGGVRSVGYFPTQNVEKMISNTSSTSVAPVT